MRRGTTEKKTVTLHSDGLDMTKIKKAVITMKQEYPRVVQIDQEITFDQNGVGTVVFTPEQTVKLSLGEVRVQVKVLIDDGTERGEVKGTSIVRDYVNGDILNEESLNG